MTPRPSHYDDYADVPEVVPGVFIDEDSVHIVDDKGEVVCWTAREVAEDASAFVAIVCATALATARGAAAVRQNIDDRGYTLSQLVSDTREATH